MLFFVWIFACTENFRLKHGREALLTITLFHVPFTFVVKFFYHWLDSNELFSFNTATNTDGNLSDNQEKRIFEGQTNFF